MPTLNKELIIINNKCHKRTVTQFASLNINPKASWQEKARKYQEFHEGKPRTRLQKNRSNSAEHSQKVASDQNSCNFFLQSCFSSFPFSTLQIDLHGRTFLQEVLNPQPTVFHFSGLTAASHEYFNGPLKDIKNEFITLLSLRDKCVSICSSYTS